MLLFMALINKNNNKNIIIKNNNDNRKTSKMFEKWRLEGQHKSWSHEDTKYVYNRVDGVLSFTLKINQEINQRKFSLYHFINFAK